MRCRSTNKRGRMILMFIAVQALVVPALATFHLMHIEQVIVSVDGDTTAQAIQLRMRSGGQGELVPSRLVVRDAAGEYPIVIADFDASVASDEAGDRVLIASPNMALYSLPELRPDFTLTRLIPAEYFAAGTLTFESDDGTTVVSRLSWGGASYTGTTAGSDDNTRTSDFGEPVPGALPVDGAQTLVFQPAFGERATSNAADFAVARDVVFTNNSGDRFEIGECTATDSDGDGWCDHIDNCPDAPNPDQADADADGAGDACDACPDDPDKLQVGACGCGNPDLDEDENGVPDCEESTPALTPCGAGAMPALALTLASLLSVRGRNQTPRH